MADGFQLLVDDARAFFHELEANNTRDWFEPRKSHYASAIRQPAELLCGLVGEEISLMTSVPHSGKVYRIHRDVRFSKDKRPYNPHLHMLWSQGSGRDKEDTAPAWFFACSPTMLTINMGIPALKGGALAAYRDMVDAHGDALTEAIERTGCDYSGWGEEPLKKVPTPYTTDHSHAEMLKRRSLILDAPLGEEWRREDGGLVLAITNRCATLLPVWRLLEAHMR
jgi:uncharacterized protein (TIGR02453 family)